MYTSCHYGHMVTGAALVKGFILHHCNPKGYNKELLTYFSIVAGDMSGRFT